MNDFMKEEFDFKRFFLINIKRIWILIAGTVIGAAIFGVIYFLNVKVFKADDVYRSNAMYHIILEPEKYEITRQYYNDATWNDVIDSDMIAGKVACDMGIDKQDIYDMTFVPTMSDISYIHLYVDGESKELVEDVQSKLSVALSDFASDDDQFIEITQVDVEDTFIVTKDYLIVRCSVVGGIIGLLLSILVLCAVSALDDSVYTIKDAKGITGAPAFYDFEEDKINEYLNSIGEDKDSVKVCNIKYGNHDGNAIRRDCERLKESGKPYKLAIIEEASSSFIKAYYGKNGDRA